MASDYKATHLTTCGLGRKTFMELILTRKSETQILVTCDCRSSHSFDLRTLVLNYDKGSPKLLDDPVDYGKAIYGALFPSEVPARHALESGPKSILLVPTDNDLDAVPWEYVYGRYG